MKESNELIGKHRELRKKIKCLSEKVRYRDKKIEALETEVAMLKEQLDDIADGNSYVDVEQCDMHKKSDEALKQKISKLESSNLILCKQIAELKNKLDDLKTATFTQRVKYAFTGKI